LRHDADGVSAAEHFIAAARAELASAVSQGEVEHYAATAGLNLSFLGLARYLRKRSDATTSKASAV
jgi:hypothetical protein